MTDVHGVTRMLGTWHIAHTNLAFWRNRLNPTIAYSIDRPAPNLRILDVVEYEDRASKTHRITGYDRPLSARETKGQLPIVNGQSSFLFEWRGKPLLTRWLRSTWGVVDHDPDFAQWAVTWFSRTPFTAEGIDIYCRAATMPDALYHNILSRLAGVGFMRRHIPGLFATLKR